MVRRPTLSDPSKNGRFLCVSCAPCYTEVRRVPLEELLLRIYAAGTYCGGLKGGAREMVRVCLGFPVIGSELPCDIGGTK